jgi:ribosomal-protein-alanine N-acetyltransferase
MIAQLVPSSALAWFEWLFGLRAPAISSASLQDAASLATLHATAFQRGWSAVEFERLLIEPTVVADRATAGARLVGFVLSRLAADEAEILSIAVAPAYRGRGVARKLLDVHMRRLTGYGVTALYLEVDERNAPARRLYGGFGFSEVGRRQSYYPHDSREAGSALILRRELG